MRRPRFLPSQTMQLSDETGQWGEGGASSPSFTTPFLSSNSRRPSTTPPKQSSSKPISRTIPSSWPTSTSLRSHHVLRTSRLLFFLFLLVRVSSSGTLTVTMNCGLPVQTTFVAMLSLTRSIVRMRSSSTTPTSSRDLSLHPLQISLWSLRISRSLFRGTSSLL